MLITRVAKLSEEEMNTLIQAGKILGNMRDNVKEFDVLDPELSELLHGLNNVILQCTEGQTE